MKYKATLAVKPYLADEMERIVNKPDSSVKGSGTEFDEEVVFNNGVRMAIQVCASDNPTEEPCWTQGVLFASDGTEMGCTDVGESFLGEYHITYDNDEYVVTVIRTPTRRETERHRGDDNDEYVVTVIA